jgi:quinohemoprotein ethanol dehydrogenase
MIEGFWRRHGRIVACFAFLAPTFATMSGMAVAQQVGSVDHDRLMKSESEPQNWMAPGGGWLEQNYSRLDQINAGNVSRLKPAWSFEFDTTRKQESSPVVVDGVMYVSTAWSKVYALNAKTGEKLWFYDPKVSGHIGVRACCDVDNRGVAVYKGKVITATLDGRLVALDAKTGKEIWSTRTFNPNLEYTITGAPRVFNDKVVIGNAGSDFGVRGFLVAYNVDTGKQAWKFYLTPRDPKKGPEGAASDGVQKMMADTWAGKWYLHGGGASPWNTIVYDPKYNLILTGTGNGSPSNPLIRSNGKGANLFTASIVAVDADTGKYAWHYQENPLEGWDYDATAPLMLATLKIGGQPRDVVMHVPKNGFFYVLDRKSGKLISADKTRPEINWAERIDLKTGLPVETPGLRYVDKTFTIYPASQGVHNWDPWSYSAKTGLVYFTSAMGGATYQVAQREMTFYKDGPNNNGAPHSAPVNGPRYPTYLAAWDPVAKKEAWHADVHGAGVLSTAGGLVFQGGGGWTGEVWALRADNGQKVWSYHTPNAINANPVSYAVDGQQYIAVVGGSGGGPVLDARAEQPGRVFVFKLDGQAKLPADPDPAMPPNPPHEKFTPEQVAHGRHLALEIAIGGFCGRCHGMTGNRGSNNLPDLRRVGELGDKNDWRKVVLEGAFEHYGMIAWKKLLSANDVEDIRAFVAGEAQKLADLKDGQAKSLKGNITPGAE